MPVLESLLRIPDAAKLCGVSPRTFWTLIANGRAPQVVRIGRCVRLRASDVNRWIRLGCPAREEFEARKEALEGKR